ncbi:MAG: peptidoglycan-binding domain-containing protein [Micropruina sp.]|uniref:peptidoglycan-binding domain-containing protein n=1 Tax=Micropruina sp. TaxID=2737536 RepID=UPI0039E42DC8
MNVRRARRLGGVGVFIAAVSLAAGAVAGAAVRPQAAPADLAKPVPVTSAPVTAESFADPRTVPVRLAVAADQPIAAGRSGRLTETLCRVERPIRSGRIVARIDDRPVLGLATSLPLYRNLASGSKGRDVRAVQRELRRLGHRVTVDGRYRAGTRAAVRSMQRKAGIAKPDGRLPLNSLVWLPAAQVTPAKCDARKGDQSNAGSTLFTVAGRLTSVSFTRPDGLVPGARTLSLYGVEAKAGQGGVADRKFLDAVAATPDYQAYVLDGKKAEVTATLQLATPVNASKVPPGAVFSLAGNAGCVQSGDRAIPVTIVGAGLGAVLFTTSETLTEVNLGAAITTDSCRRAG